MSQRHPCFHYNHEPFPDRVETQSGWETHMVMLSSEFVREVRVPRMVSIPNQMSKDCKQHGPFGAATIYGWDCSGCRWRPEKQEGGTA